MRSQPFEKRAESNRLLERSLWKSWNLFMGPVIIVGRKNM